MSILAINKKAQFIEDRVEKDVSGYAFSDCCPSFAPGWEVGSGGGPDPCPWKTDLRLCWQTCYWTGSVPDQGNFGSWMDTCGNVNAYWLIRRPMTDNG